MPDALQSDMFDTLSVLADTTTYKHASRDGYIAIAIDAPSHPNTNAVTIHKNGDLSFFTKRKELLDQAESVGFKVTDRKKNYVDGYRFSKVTIADVQQNIPLFKQLVIDSVAIVTDRYETKKQKKSGEPR